MLLAVISDTHLPRGQRRLPARLPRAASSSADLILHAGDVLSASTLAELELIGPPVVAVQGNQDDAELCRRLPVERTVEAEDARIAMVHDAGPRIGAAAPVATRFPDAHAVVFGHSHIPLHEQDDGFQIFNPGSPTDRRRAPAHTMGVARVSGDQVEFELVEVG